MRRIKRLGALLIALVMVFSMIPITTAGAVSESGEIVLVMNSTEFTVNGTKTKIDEQGSKPLQEKGYTMLPLRAILEATGGTLTYDANTQKITIVRGGDTVVLTLGSKTAVVNGSNRTLGAAPYAKNSRTLVHIRTLELFGMKVDWDEKTNNVTVKYVEPSKIFNLTLRNGMGTPYTSIQIAPMGAGENDWSGNLLGADTLQINQNLTVQAPITGTGLYQLRCGYASTNQTMYHTINNINLTGMTDKADILMNSTTTPSVALDGVTITTRNIQLFIINNSGKTLSALYYKKSSDQFYNQTNLLGTQMLSNGGQTTATFPYDSAAVGYDFYATCSPSGNETYTAVKLGVATSQQSFATLTLGSNGRVSASNSTSSSSTNNSSNSGDTEITFRNNSGSKIYEIRATTSSGTTAIKNGTTVWSDSDGLKNGGSVTFNMDLRDTYRWYFGAYTSTRTTSSPAYTGSVNFRSSGVTSARLTLTEESDGYELMDADLYDCYGCSYDDDIKSYSDAEDEHERLKDKYGSSITEEEYDDLSSSDRRHYDSAASKASFALSQIKTDGSKTSSSSNSYGDVDLNLMAGDGIVKAFYIIDKDDYNSSKMTDPDDFEDAYESLLDGRLNEYSYTFLEDALESGENNYLAWVIGSKLYKAKVAVDSDAEWASVVTLSKNSVDYADSDDNTALVLLENDGVGKSVSVKMTNSRSSSKTQSVADDDFAYLWLDCGSSSSAARWTFEASAVDDDLTEDLSEYNGFIHVNFNSNRFRAYEIDD